MKFKTLLFDFDGTLVDSMPTFASVMLRILDENNIPYESDIVKVITPLGYGGTAKHFIKLGLDKPEKELVAQMNAYAEEEYTHNIKAKENVKSTLQKLKEQGVSLNVLTASPHSLLDVCLKRNGIYGLFSNVWSCDDFNTTKSDPEIYKMAAKRMGVSVGEVLFFDDNLGANKTARAAGMHTCGVYDASSDNYIEEIKEATDFYIYGFSEILEI